MSRQYNQSFVIKIGRHSIPVEACQLAQRPVFEARRVSFACEFLALPLQRWLRDTFLPHQPLHIRRWLLETFPLWFLPTRFIVKEVDPEDTEAFGREALVYNDRLQHLQGDAIAIYYGKALCVHSGETEEREALLLQTIDGTPLIEYTVKEAEERDFKNQIEEVYRPLSEAGVVQGDPEPRHVMLTGMGWRVIDFGEAMVMKTAEAAELNKNDVAHIWYKFCLLRKSKDLSGTET